MTFTASSSGWRPPMSASFSGSTTRSGAWLDGYWAAQRASRDVFPARGRARVPAHHNPGLPPRRGIPRRVRRAHGGSPDPRRDRIVLRGRAPLARSPRAHRGPDRYLAFLARRRHSGRSPLARRRRRRGSRRAQRHRSFRTRRALLDGRRHHPRRILPRRPMRRRGRRRRRPHVPRVQSPRRAHAFPRCLAVARAVPRRGRPPLADRAGTARVDRFGDRLHAAQRLVGKPLLRRRGAEGRHAPRPGAGRVGGRTRRVRQGVVRADPEGRSERDNLRRRRRTGTGTGRGRDGDGTGAGRGGGPRVPSRTSRCRCTPGVSAFPRIGFIAAVAPGTCTVAVTAWFDLLRLTSRSRAGDALLGGAQTENAPGRGAGEVRGEQHARRGRARLRR